MLATHETLTWFELPEAEGLEQPPLPITRQFQEKLPLPPEAEAVASVLITRVFGVFLLPLLKDVVLPLADAVNGVYADQMVTH